MPHRYSWRFLVTATKELRSGAVYSQTHVSMKHLSMAAGKERPHERKYSRMDQVRFVETAFKKLEGIWSA